eukprot:scaffold2722_cov233-Pinguiococcus_pyrenoidosus.AAC.7
MEGERLARQPGREGPGSFRMESEASRRLRLKAIKRAARRRCPEELPSQVRSGGRAHWRLQASSYHREQLRGAKPSRSPGRVELRLRGPPKGAGRTGDDALLPLRGPRGGGGAEIRQDVPELVASSLMQGVRSALGGCSQRVRLWLANGDSLRRRGRWPLSLGRWLPLVPRLHGGRLCALLVSALRLVQHLVPLVGAVRATGFRGRLSGRWRLFGGDPLHGVALFLGGSDHLAAVLALVGANSRGFQVRQSAGASRWVDCAAGRLLVSLRHILSQLDRDVEPTSREEGKRREDAAVFCSRCVEAALAVRQYRCRARRLGRHQRSTEVPSAKRRACAASIWGPSEGGSGRSVPKRRLIDAVMAAGWRRSPSARGSERSHAREKSESQVEPHVA